VADGAVFTMAGAGRELAVTHHAGYPVAQVFSPAGAQFLCLEPMTAPADALRSGQGLRRAVPRRPFTAAFSIGVRAV
jgi:galactose mutarotase-like enzyme